MNETFAGTDENRARLARALAALKDMRAQVDALQRARSEPIAVIGLGCRYPGGVHDPESFWRLLREQRDAIGEVPPDRWDIDAYYDARPDAPGKISTRFGGFLDQVDRFDPYFFGIAPREACSLDPQQRLLLEVAWEALEHAGVAADRLRGSRTGVYVGIGSSEYAHLLLAAPPDKIDSYMGSGNASSVAAGRLSYVFGFEGPSIAVDTACSSSLVAVHLACQSLRLGECDLALAGGVNVILAPAISINHSRAKMLAPDGRCKTFDARADGFVRSEGCGLVALKRLSDALADRDVILAQIRGSAMNQDGRTSGLTVPSGPAQQRVVRDALALAGCSPADVSYVEAHGTGTALGDPIELNALAAVFAERPVERPLVVGSVKTNIGHAEAAAGIAGLIKMILALTHETIPASLHFRQPNPRVAWHDMPVTVAASALAWRRGATPRIAGVSSFGFGGTNAHVIVAEPPRSEARVAKPEPTRHLLALSAQSDEALTDLAGRYAAHLRHHPGHGIGDICHTANTGRSHLQHRLAVVAGSGTDLADRLDSIAGGRDAGGVMRGSGTARAPRIAFLCTGQGSQYTGMARELFKTQPVFRCHLEACDALLRDELEHPLLDLLYAGTRDDLLHQTLYTQPALFALEYALGSLWMSRGIVPELLVGHSLGEYVAACLAGVFSFEDGLRLVAARARLMQNLPGEGAMTALLVGEAEVRSAIAALAPDVSVAAINGPQHTVVSGVRASVERVAAHFAAKDVECHALNVSQAFHSELIAPMLAEFARVAARVTFAPPRLDVVSNLTGAVAGAELMRPEYWCRQAREPVQFLAGMLTCEQLGIEAFVEIGPHPVLSGMGKRCVVQPGSVWLPSLRRGQDDGQVMLEALGALYVRGAAVDWQAFDAPHGHRRVHAPTYPFQRQRYWVAPHDGRGASPAERARDSRRQSLLGVRQHVAREPDAIMFESELAAGQHRLLDDHRVFGAAIMPASGYIDLALSAGTAALAAPAMRLEDLVFHRPLVAPDTDSRIVQTSLQGDVAGGYAFQVHSRGDDAELETGSAWTLHASGMLRVEAVAPAAPREDMTALRARMVDTIAPDAFYAAYAERGIAFGPSLRVLDEIRRRDGEAIARIRLSESAARIGDDGFDPAWLDACAQVLGAATPATDTTYLEAAIRQVRIYRRPDGAAWCHARTRAGASAAACYADLRLLDDAGEGSPSARISTGAESRPAAAASVRPDSASAPQPELYSLRWLPQPRAVSSLAAPPEPAALAAVLQPRLDHALSQAELVDYAEALAGLDALAPAFVAEAFRQLGWPYRVGEEFASDDVRNALGVVPAHARLLARFLALLAHHGVLRRAGQRWQLATDLPERPRLDVAARTCAGAQAELEMLARCGSRLADVLTARCDPLQLLFPDGDRTAAAKIYRDSPGAAAMNGLLQAAVKRLRESWPAGRPLRILEVGAGTGGATAHVVPELPPHTHYVYTDVSRGFFAEARRRFADHDFFRYEILDIERPPGEQGFAGQQFDVVIAFNVLHATRRLRDTVAHVGELLADDGLLLLLENTEPADWVDLIWGLTPGWWRFDDHDLRPAHPLLTSAQWRGLLTESGFAGTEVVAAGPQHHDGLSRQALVIARKAAGAVATTRRRGPWLILADRRGVGDRLAAAIESTGERAIRVNRGAGFSRSRDGVFTVDPLAADDVRQLLAQLQAADGAPPRGVIHLWGLDAADMDSPSSAALMSESVAAAASVLHVVQTLIQAPAPDKREPSPCLWLVTRGAQPVREGDDPPHVAQAALWGMGKAVAREHPEVWGGMVDLDPAATADDVSRILDEIRAPDGEDHVAFRGGQRLVARVMPCGAVPQRATAVLPDATYLITGGCGALGLETARWLVAQGGRHLALVGRGGAVSDAARTAIADLQRHGAAVTVYRADVADEAAIAQVLAQIRASGFPLRGLIHAAGLPGHATIAKLDVAAFERMFAAKVAGTWVLHRLTRDMALDFFVCFSSMVSLWGTKEQCHYIAANHVLDVFTHHRRALRLPALCVNWGPLSGGGMLPSDDIGELARLGVSATPLAEAPRVLSVLLASGRAQAAAVSIDWPLFAGIYQSRGPCRMFDVVSAARAPVHVAPAPLQPAGVLARLRDAPASGRRDILRSHLRTTLGQVLEMDGSRIPDQRGFFDMGLDSLTAMELRTRLQGSLGMTLPATLAFDYGTLDALADFLLKSKLDPVAPAPVADVRSAEVPVVVSQEMLEQMSEAEAERLLEAKLLTL